jgi:predicted butyrate kinase (DUF1464 family)
LSEYLPANPLLDLVSPEGNVSHIASVLGVSRGAVNYWRKMNSIQLYKADRLCCEILKIHPSELWPEWGMGADSD